MIINTCSGDPLTGQPKYGRRSYSQRLELLRDEILPAAIAEGWDEIIVAGQFVEGPGYTLASMPPMLRDRRDALWQRELGARLATGSLLAFSHDDHMFAPGTFKLLHAQARDGEWDILVPRRVDRAGAPLNNGADRNYMGGHSLVMRRWLWARVPWTTCDTEWWDISMTRIWRDEGARIVFDNAITHIDMDT